MRIAFFGTPAFAVPSLDAIAASPHTLCGVVTQPDRARGRGQRVTPAPVKARALELGVPVLQPERLRDEVFLASFEAWQADLAVVAAYGRILPARLLDSPRLGMINVHASLLPRWRGAAPIQRAILAGDKETGVTIMRVVEALDAGPMLARQATPIDPDETSVVLERRLSEIGARLLIDVVDRLATETVLGDPQDEALVTYADRVTRADGVVDWDHPAQAIHDRIRALHPWPHASASIGGRRLLLIESHLGSSDTLGAIGGTILDTSRSGILVATGHGTVALTRVQPEGRAAMAAADFANGYRVAAGMRFDPPDSP
jgi:methionyl-tRNA formyltransferase